MSDAAPLAPSSVPSSAPEVSCYGKHAYRDERTAHQTAARIYQDRGTWLRVYLCDVCGQYHLTHKNALPPPDKRWRPPADSRHKRDDDHRDWRRRRGGRRRRR